MPTGQFTQKTKNYRRQLRDRFITKLQEAQAVTGLTTQEIAPEIGVSALTISKYMRGQVSPRPGEQYETAIGLMDLMITGGKPEKPVQRKRVQKKRVEKAAAKPEAPAKPAAPMWQWGPFVVGVGAGAGFFSAATVIAGVL